MNNNTQFVVIATRYSSSFCDTELISFDNKEEAQSGLNQLKEALNKGSLSWSIRLIEKRKYSLSDIYMKLLESNPMGSASDMWSKAQEVFNLIEAEFNKK